MASKLFVTDKFELYHCKFPEELKSAVEAYSSLDKSKLQTELKTLDMRPDFKEHKGAVPLLQFYLENGMQDALSETLKLLRILVIIPMTSSECERCFSTLKRIETFLRSTMKGKSLNFAVLSIEKEFVRDLPDFNKRVTEAFANQKDCRMDFLFETYSSK